MNYLKGLRNNLKRSRRCLPVGHLLAALTVFLLLAHFAVYPGWTRIGLDGMRVTSITTGKVWSDTMLFAGTDSGVYYRVGNGVFQPLTSQGSAVMPAGLRHVRSLYLASAFPQLFAGGDSGFYSYHFTSGLPPTWNKINGIYGSVVAIAGFGDTITAASEAAVYRSVDGGTVWVRCTLSCTLNRRPVYTSLAFWKGINAGSDDWPGNAPGWIGVANSPDYGQTWDDISQLAGQPQRLKAVYCLATYAEMWNTPRRLIAGTAAGIQWVDDLDTGTWRPLTPQLTKAPARSLYITTYSKSELSLVFALTDSGVFFLAPKTQSDQWILTLKKRAYGMTSFQKSDPAEWFAAVEDGVYRYDESTPVNARRATTGKSVSGRKGFSITVMKKINPGFDLRGRSIIHASAGGLIINNDGVRAR